MIKSGIYFSQSYEGKIEPIVLNDKYGSVNFYLLPFIRPLDKSFTEGVRTAIEEMQVDSSQRNVLVAHQLVTGSIRSDSEDITIGTLEDVETSVFSSFILRFTASFILSDWIAFSETASLSFTSAWEF